MQHGLHANRRRQLGPSPREQTVLGGGWGANVNNERLPSTGMRNILQVYSYSGIKDAGVIHLLGILSPEHTSILLLRSLP